MSDYKIGEASWDENDVSVGNQPAQRKSIPFLKMEHKKSYKVRIISQPYKYYAKWTKTAGGNNIKLNSSLTDDCPLCQDGESPKPGWYVKVLWRDGDKVVPCVLDMGIQIRKGIELIQNNPDYGKKVSEYDITISKGAKNSQPLYAVTPSPPKALTDEEKAIAAKIARKEINGQPNDDYIDLEERCKPLPAETIRKILAGETTSNAGGDTQRAQSPAQAAAQSEEGVFDEPEESSATEDTQEETASSTTTVDASDKDFLDF